MRSTRKYCNGENIELQISTDLNVFNTPKYENVVYMGKLMSRWKHWPRDSDGFTFFHPAWKRESGFQSALCMYACMYVCMYVLLISTWAVRRILFLFGI
jgi:hypothetical protein